MIGEKFAEKMDDLVKALENDEVAERVGANIGAVLMSILVPFIGPRFLRRLGIEWDRKQIRAAIFVIGWTAYFAGRNWELGRDFYHRTQKKTFLKGENS